MMKIFRTFRHLLLRKKFFSHTGSTAIVAGTYIFNPVPADIYNDPDHDSASGSFLFSGSDKKYSQDPDHKTTHPEAVVKDINEQNNYDHPLNPNNRA
jgi:hypothetical protein